MSKPEGNMSNSKEASGGAKGDGLTLEKGRAHPLGATPDADGVNFSVFSEHATGVTLLLFDSHDDEHPVAEFELSPTLNRTFHFWHGYVRGAGPGTHYAFRVDGRWEPDKGSRFNPNKVLIDPYSRGTNKSLWKRGDACGPENNLATSMRSVVIDLKDYDWAGDEPLKRPLNETVVYEMHVGGFTRHASSGVRSPGTFAGVIEKIPYLRELGVTAVELLPVFDFDDTEERLVEGRRLVNYWGYSTMAYFSPHSGYCENPQEGEHVREFRDMVKALHAAGIEVILDVVYNHTDEGNHQGPVFSFRGFDNAIYYHLVKEDPAYYYDYTGCGNTFNCNHPIGAKLILDSLRYWVQEMHVDGFRFDEASVLSRGEDGNPLTHPPVLWQTELDEILADTKINAEAWDAAGLYQVGHFPGYRWAEWNGRFRDEVRKFVKGEPGLVESMAARLTGSPDLYQSSGHLPVNSVNFINAHDGFTLNDLVSYDRKHNDANGEENRDGVDDNDSWNCGAEGPADDPAVETLRDRQMKNFATLLLISQGVPMFVMGDEVRRTQGGNNNAYCHDNEISWFDWTLVEKNQHLFRFWKHMIRFRLDHPTLHRSRFFTGAVNERGLQDLTWHGVDLNSPGWDDPDARALAFTLAGFDGEADIHVMANMYWEPLEMAVPTADGRNWLRVVDTSQPSPDDVREAGSEVPFSGERYAVGGRSVVVLISC